MIRLIAEGLRAINGAGRLLTFREGGHAMFDISLTGFWRSFAAILFALPLVVLVFFERNHLALPIPADLYFLSFVANWLSFPAAAALTCVVIGARDRFLPWVIVHNWGVIWLYGAIVMIWSLQVIGLISPEFRDFLVYLYWNLRLLVHWRIAYVALGVPTITSAFAAVVPLLVSMIISVAIAQAYAPPPPA